MVKRNEGMITPNNHGRRCRCRCRCRRRPYVPKSPSKQLRHSVTNT